MKKLTLLLLLLALEVGAGNVWVDLYGESFHDTKGMQSMADTWYTALRAGVSFKPVDVYTSYLQYGLYNVTESRIAYVGVGVKKPLMLGPVFLEPFGDYFRDPEFKTNSFRVGFFTSWVLKEW